MAPSDSITPSKEEGFEARHFQIDDDPLIELKRRCQLWAMCPPSRDVSLEAQIVPLTTIYAAIREIEASRLPPAAAREETGRGDADGHKPVAFRGRNVGKGWSYIEDVTEDQARDVFEEIEPLYLHPPASVPPNPPPVEELVEPAAWRIEWPGKYTQRERLVHAAGQAGFGLCDCKALAEARRDQGAVITPLYAASALTSLSLRVKELEEALSTARPIVWKWCQYQGNTPNIFDQYVAPIDKVLARTVLHGEGE